MAGYVKKYDTHCTKECNRYLNNVISSIISRSLTDKEAGVQCE